MSLPLFSVALPVVGTSSQVDWNYDQYWPQPNQTSHTPPAVLGIDGWGQPQVRGYGKQVWIYKTLPPDKWYYILSLWRKSQQVPNLAGVVQIQWPDPSTGSFAIATCALEPPTHQSRDMAVFRQATLTFTHLGDGDLTGRGFYLPVSRYPLAHV